MFDIWISNSDSSRPEGLGWLLTPEATIPLGYKQVSFPVCMSRC